MARAVKKASLGLSPGILKGLGQGYRLNSTPCGKLDFERRAWAIRLKAIIDPAGGKNWLPWIYDRFSSLRVEFVHDFSLGMAVALRMFTEYLEEPVKY
jgi:hypothetical protein